jgi:hypothetical protein
MIHLHDKEYLEDNDSTSYLKRSLNLCFDIPVNPNCNISQYFDHAVVFHTDALLVAISNFITRISCIYSGGNISNKFQEARYQVNCISSRKSINT